jgi:hypothetical protein
MPNSIFRNRMVNSVDFALREAAVAREVAHPGMQGRIRELVMSHLLRPALPLGFDIAGGKVVNSQGDQSAETDVIVYSRAVLAPIMYSECDGIVPVEAAYYAVEIKSQLTAATLRDSIAKAQAMLSVIPVQKHEAVTPPRSPVIPTLFAFDSDLVAGSSELERYANYDPAWNTRPAVRAICVAGRGYWYHSVDPEVAWVEHAPSAEHDEVIDFVSGVVNTLLANPPAKRSARLGAYLMAKRASKRIPGQGA